MHTPRLFLLAVALALVPATRAVPIVYTAYLDGPSESPPVPSPGTGNATVAYDPAAHTLAVSASFANLLAGTTAAHIHAPTAVPLTGTAGVATQTPSFAGFPLGVTAGSFSNIFDLTQVSSFNPAFVTANGGSAGSAEAVLASSLASGRSYFNIHTTAYPGGEIRGFLVAASVPDAGATGVLLLLTLPACLALERRRRASSV